MARAAKLRRARVLSRHVVPRELWRPRVSLPLRVGRFVIAEPGGAEPLAPGEVLIQLEPGLVFGGGDHPTTRACLLALSALLNRSVPERVLDLGTGTGILALAAALAGSKKVRAVDINPLAVATARQNVRLNRVGRAVEVVEGDGLDELGRGDLVLLNLGPSLIERAAPGLGGYGYVVASGFLEGEEEGILGALRGTGFSLLSRHDDQGWPALLLEREGDG